ncbi:TPA: hypothetical protein DDZ86_00450 [Candidatus Dependentiae bacterium]|nr:hypothetical protein [Candidatus Dependentiae bacterium]
MTPFYESSSSSPLPYFKSVLLCKILYKEKTAPVFLNPPMNHCAFLGVYLSYSMELYMHF